MRERGHFFDGSNIENKPNNIYLSGILAHVDAGKTTLSEGILYLTGQIRKLEELTMEMRFWTHIRWREAGGLPFFPSRRILCLETSR